MSVREGGATGEKKGKKKHVNKPTSEKWKHYKIVDGKIQRDKTCPRCGAGIFLAVSKDRMFCGKCKYTEFLQKTA